MLVDGFLFLNTIIEGVLCYRPERLFLMVFLFFLLLGGIMGMYPVEYYWHHRRVEEWMIYRFIACIVLGSAGYMLLCAAVLSNRMAVLGPKRRDGDSFWIVLVFHLFHGVPLYVFCTATLAVSLALVWPGLVEYVFTRKVYLHWSRIMVGAFGMFLVFQTLLTAVMLRLVALWKYQRLPPMSLDPIPAQVREVAAPIGATDAQGFEDI